MVNTGYKQATVAYKVSKPDGKPLDIFGISTEISGRRQAIAVLEGYPNPDDSKYEIELRFKKAETVGGNPTITYNIHACPFGYIRISPSRVSLTPEHPTETVILESSNKWRLLSGPTDIADVDYTEGVNGSYPIRITYRANGQGTFIFQNLITSSTASVFVICSTDQVWILDTGFWNNRGFWFDNGIWNY